MTDHVEQTAPTDDGMQRAAELLRMRYDLAINAKPRSREELEFEHGQVWDTVGLSGAFEVVGFASPFVVVRRRSDGQLGSLMFQHHPRLYFVFEPDPPEEP